jgi:farnesyl-diphosphate farnesyltransferase
MESRASFLAAQSGPPSGPAELHPFLQKTSRTFALSIPFLPEPARTEIGVAYLLFRIIDTFEDAARWPAAARIDALARFVGLLDGPPHEAERAVADWLRTPPIDHAGYLELLAATPQVLGWFAELSPAARREIRSHLTRSAEGMATVVRRAGEDGSLALETIQELRDYCYIVAGIVGQMLTELFVLTCPSLQTVADELRTRAVAFGEALQLVNILKDAQPDAAERRTYLPKQASLAEVFVLARTDLRDAMAYTDLLRKGGADAGLVAFNALNARLAVGTLRRLRGEGLGAKLTRTEVLSIASQVIHAAETNAPLFPEQP